MIEVTTVNEGFNTPPDHFQVVKAESRRRPVLLRKQHTLQGLPCGMIPFIQKLPNLKFHRSGVVFIFDKNSVAALLQGQGKNTGMIKASL